MEESLVDEVKRAFGGNADEVLGLLSQYGCDESHREVERVRCDIVSLSRSDVTRLEHYVDVALTDYRDVIMWAEYPPADDDPRSYEELRARLRDHKGGTPPGF